MRLLPILSNGGKMLLFFLICSMINSCISTYVPYSQYKSISINDKQILVGFYPTYKEVFLQFTIESDTVFPNRLKLNLTDDIDTFKIEKVVFYNDFLKPLKFNRFYTDNEKCTFYIKICLSDFYKKMKLEILPSDFIIQKNGEPLITDTIVFYYTKFYTEKDY